METFSIFVVVGAVMSMRYFQTEFLDEAVSFIEELDSKTRKKVLYNIDLAEQTNDPKLLKKLHNDIWEFRTLFGGIQIRLLAFWDKSENARTLVIATHGFVKKQNKIPAKEISRAIRLREIYLSQIK